MFASVNNSTDSSGQIIGYISNAGIPSIANQTVQELDVITPYSVFPLVLLDNAVGLAWWKNIVDGKKMQSTFLLLVEAGKWTVCMTDSPEQIHMEAVNQHVSMVQQLPLSSHGIVRSRP